MKVNTYKCDVCGKQKGDVNHWWLMDYIVDPAVRELTVRAWDEDELGEFGSWDFHLCGAECVQKKVNEFLSKPVAKAPEV